MHKKLYLIILLIFARTATAQTYVFAELSGSPNINTAGWNLTGNAYAGDTPGDGDSNPDELILTNAANSQSGGVFWSEPIDPSICTKWIVEFDYRIWGGSAADGIAFCFLDVPPAGFVSGGGVGIPGTSNGLKVILDTWNNCGGPNPELQIFNGVGYNECAPGIFKVDNSSGTLGFVRSNAYQPAKITYDNGTIEFYINNILYLSVFSPVTFSGYMGFTASTGGANDQHSVKNVIIYTEQAESEAGPESVSTCSNTPIQIGTIDNPLFEYSWSPTTGLDNPYISNPTVTLTNSSGSPLNQTYTVTTSLAANPGVCPTTDDIDVTIYSTYDEILDINQCGGDYVFDGVTYSQSGQHIANFTSSNGCDSMVTLNLNIWDLPILNVLDQVICLNDNIILQATGAQTYQWIPANPGDGIDGNLSVTPNVTTIYTVTGIDGNGCSATASATVTVNDLPNINASASIYEICIGDSTVLSAEGGLEYSWEGNNLFDPFLATQTIFPTLSGTYILSGTDINGCSNTDDIDITVNPLPTIDLLVNPSEICFGEQATLSASGASVYSWQGSNIVFNNGNNITVAPDDSENYLVIGTSIHGCTDSLNYYLNVNPLPILTITPSQEICFGDSATIFVQGADAYAWDPIIQNQDDMQLATVSPLNTTTYTVIGTDLNGCESSINSTIIIIPLPEADFLMSPSDLDIFQNTSTQLFNNSWNATSYHWEFGDGSSSDETDPQHNFEVEGTGNYFITLYAYNNLGCVDSVTYYVTISNGLVYYIPNTFTPDGDQYNQSFKPILSSGFDEYDLTMEIYDRWGELIFETHDIEFGWDGTYSNNKLVPDGTYNYVIKYKVPNNDDHGYIYGHVNLIR